MALPLEIDHVSNCRGIWADLHTKVLDARVVARAKNQGISVLVYAPHFIRLPDIRVAAERYTDDDLTVIPGREIFTGSWRNRKHVLAIDLEHPIPDYITLDAAMDELNRQDAVVLIPHPTFASVSFTAADIHTYQSRIHAIETYNPKHLPRHNARAKRLAADLDLPVFASSYAHLRGTIGEVWTAFPDSDPTADDIITALRSHTPRTVHHRPGVGHHARCVIERAHLLYENTISRLGYSFLTNRATNPYHPAYNGRFDEAAVYAH